MRRLFVSAFPAAYVLSVASSSYTALSHSSCSSRVPVGFRNFHSHALLLTKAKHDTLDDTFDADEDHHHDMEGGHRRHASTKSHHAGAAATTHKHEGSHHKASHPKSESTEDTISVFDHKMQVVNVTPVMKFEDVPEPMPQWLKHGLKTLGYPTTTSIQSITIPPLLEGRDLIGLAPTGSGKTVAFAVPALKMFERSPEGLPTILVLAPTRELVQQTAKVFRSLGGNSVHVCEAYGGEPREIQSRKLSRGCDVLVACPGRLKDFLENGIVRLDHLRFLVFDEADRLLDMGFKIQLDDIMGYIDPHAPRQTMMWSATWPASVQRLAAEYLHPERYIIRAGSQGTGAQVNERIRQHIHFADESQEKIERLVSWIQDGTIKEEGCKMMIFVERQTDTDEVAHLLVRRLGIRSSNVSVLHGGMPQKRRDYVMQNFKNNTCRILVATDVASRGLDFPDVTVVVNFCPPKDIDSYCHRIGRTGRAGRSGDAFTFIESNSFGLAKDLAGFLEKCKMNVPDQLRRLGERFRPDRNEGGGYGRRSGGGFRRGGGGHRSHHSSGFEESSYSWGNNRGNHRPTSHRSHHHSASDIDMF